MWPANEEENRLIASIGFHKAHEGHYADEAIGALSKYYDLVEKAEGFYNSIVLKSFCGNLAVGCGLWKRGTSLQSLFMIPQLGDVFELLTSIGNLDVLLYEPSNVNPIKKNNQTSLSEGNLVHIRKLTISETANQEKLIDCSDTYRNSLSLLDGLLELFFNVSIDGKIALEVGIWKEYIDSAAAACFLSEKGGNYWSALVDQQELHFLQVVYVSHSHR